MNLAYQCLWLRSTSAEVHLEGPSPCISATWPSYVSSQMPQLLNKILSSCKGTCILSELSNVLQSQTFHPSNAWGAYSPDLKAALCSLCRYLQGFAEEPGISSQINGEHGEVMAGCDVPCVRAGQISHCPN